MRKLFPGKHKKMKKCKIQFGITQRKIQIRDSLGIGKIRVLIEYKRVKRQLQKSIFFLINNYLFLREI